MSVRALISEMISEGSYVSEVLLVFYGLEILDRIITAVCLLTDPSYNSPEQPHYEERSSEGSTYHQRQEAGPKGSQYRIGCEVRSSNDSLYIGISVPSHQTSRQGEH